MANAEWDSGSPKKIRVVVEVRGGVCQAVYANIPPGYEHEVEVVDWDNVEAGDPGPDSIEDATAGLTAIY